MTAETAEVRVFRRPSGVTEQMRLFMTSVAQQISPMPLGKMAPLSSEQP